MKAFEKYPLTRYSFKYPEDMAQILAYLSHHGILRISETDVEKYYSDFSDEHYCAGWMQVDEQRLEEFADYLSEKEI